MTTFQVKALQKALQTAREKNHKYILDVFQESLGKLLNRATECGDTECVRHLIRAGADVNFEEDSYSQDSVRASRLAISSFFGELASTYPHGGSYIQEYFHEYVAHSAACSFCIATCVLNALSDQELVYRHRFRQVVTPLSAATTSGSAECVSMLLDAGADMHTDIGKDAHNDELLRHLTPVSIVLFKGNLEVLHLFFKHGFNVVTDLDINIMHLVHDDCLPVLLKKGTWTMKLRKITPLTIAAGSLGGDEEDEDCVPALHEEKPPASLMYLSRAVIRKQLLKCNKENLFATATQQKLPLPKNLCRYLVCDFDI